MRQPLLQCANCLLFSYLDVDVFIVPTRKEISFHSLPCLAWLDAAWSLGISCFCLGSAADRRLVNRYTSHCNISLPSFLAWASRHASHPNSSIWICRFFASQHAFQACWRAQQAACCLALQAVAEDYGQACLFGETASISAQTVDEWTNTHQAHQQKEQVSGTIEGIGKAHVSCVMTGLLYTI